MLRKPLFGLAKHQLPRTLCNIYEAQYTGDGIKTEKEFLIIKKVIFSIDI